MERSGLFLGLILSAALGVVGCGNADERAEMQEQALESHAGATGDETTVTGCLTSAPDRAAYAVTVTPEALATAVNPTKTDTYTYELVGNAADLAQHVGKEVQVMGRLADFGDEVEVEKKEEATLEPRQSGDEKVTPAIETKTEAEINVRRLHVSTITPTGQPCMTQQGS